MLPFVIYADFESLLVKNNKKKVSPNGQLNDNITILNNHKPLS